MTFERPETDAYVTRDGQYRYWLTRTWDEALPPLPWVMLNPSTADHRQDDPTIRRVARFSHDCGFGGVLVMNLFAYRATEPERLVKADDPVGPENDAWLDRLLERQIAADAPIVCGWGVHGDILYGTPFPAASRRGTRWTHHATTRGARLLCLGSTKAGFPKHPLYLPTEEPLRPYGAAP